MEKNYEWKKFLLAMGVSVATGFASVGMAVIYFKEYGFYVFVLLPVYLGFTVTTLYGRTAKSKVFLNTFLVLLFMCLPLIIFAIEGLICLVMAFPIAYLLALIGALFGMITWNAKRSLTDISPLIFLILSPFLLSFESSHKFEPTVHQVVSTVEINAPIERVWKNVIEFPQIEKQPEGILRLGFAYPINAKIEGEGVGAVRYCNFNTGAFVEPITDWQEPNLLAFDVKEQPAPMTEISPYDNLQSAHLDYIKSRRGQFRLYEKDGKTIVEGTTFYTHDIAPDFYWNLFSDEIIHQIHLRVLNHIKEVSER